MDCVDHKVTLPSAEIYDGVDCGPLPKKSVSEKSYIGSKYQVQWLRQKICKTLHHHYFQIFVCVLVLLDTAVVVAEIMIETSNKNEEDHSSAIVLVERILHYTSLSILTFFMLEITTKIFAMGLSFFKHKLEIFDAVIVSVSFFLDIFLSPGGIKDGVEFLVLLRLWRITRIINGIVISIKSRAEEKVRLATEEKERLQQQCTKLEKQIERLEFELNTTKDQLASLKT